ncbi:hypothetical protein T439DRAFT_216602 [Meredithblackwellia eburnea MCA 4105]
MTSQYCSTTCQKESWPLNYGLFTVLPHQTGILSDSRICSFLTRETSHRPACKCVPKTKTKNLSSTSINYRRNSFLAFHRSKQQFNAAMKSGTLTAEQRLEFQRVEDFDQWAELMRPSLGLASHSALKISTDDPMDQTHVLFVDLVYVPDGADVLQKFDVTSIAVATHRQTDIREPGVRKLLDESAKHYQARLKLKSGALATHMLSRIVLRGLRSDGSTITGLVKCLFGISTTNDPLDPEWETKLKNKQAARPSLR